MLRIGIDPGNTGAVAVLGINGFVDVHDMPLMASGKKQQVNAAELFKILLSIKAMSAGGVDAVVEKVSAMPGQGVSSMFNFGMGFGVIQGVLAGAGIPYTLVTPQSWKKRAGLIGKDKDMARTVAQQLYPDAPLGRKKDIGRADAILIARFGV
jgi:crossover junction endodeoxyribonuclease RuvC